MIPKTFGTMMWRAMVYLRRSPVNIFELIVWPLILVIPFGLFAMYTAASPELLMILIIGSIGWVTTGSVQRELVLNFMIEIWQRTIKKARTLPISDVVFVTGNWFVGITRGLFTFVLITGVSLLLFGVNIFAADPIVLASALAGIFLTGLVIGMFIISTVKLLGHRADAIAWFLTEILVVVSGIYYSVSLLPKSIQLIASASPLTYIFESLRQTLIHGQTFATLAPMIGKMFVLIFIFLGLVSWFWVYAENQAVKTGFYQKYD